MVTFPTMKINEKNLCAFASCPPFDLDGHLMKKGEVNKAFQRRYFVLKGNLLFYFEKKGDREPLGLILLEGCTIELSEDSDQYCFEIAFNGNRTYVLSTDSQDRMETWMKALTCAGYEYKKLMVADLQRKLEEIKDSQNRSFSESATTIPQAPQPPPRRYNPFNTRPAPPPPLPSNSDKSMVHGSVNSRLGSSLSESTSSAANNNKTLVLPILKKKHKDAVDFQVLHADFRTLVMSDVTEYRLKAQPLVQF